MAEETQFIVTVPKWTPDTLRALEEAAGPDATVHVVRDGEIAIVQEDRWISREDLEEFWYGRNPEDAEIIWTALLEFNQKAENWRFDTSPEIFDQIIQERVKLGMPVDHPTVDFQLVMDGERIAASSIRTLAHHRIALVCLGLDLAHTAMLQEWSARLGPVPA